jgi:transmembrane sensor
VLAVLALFGTWWHPGELGWKTYNTEIGVSQSVLLEDGSSVLLNTNSEVRVLIGPGSRRIQLVRGEALFTVAHNPDWPFDVTANGITVRAVGTAFDLRLADDRELDLVVSEGRVRVGGTDEFDVERSGDLLRLAMVEGGGLAVVRGGIVTLTSDGTAAVDRKLAWTRGQLVLNGQTLAAVVHEINRYNRDQLEIADPSIARLMIGGTISPKNLKGFLAQLRYMHQIVAVESGKTIDGAAVFKLCGPRVAARCSSRAAR